MKPSYWRLSFQFNLVFIAVCFIIACREGQVREEFAWLAAFAAQFSATCFFEAAQMVENVDNINRELIKQNRELSQALQHGSIEYQNEIANKV